MNSHYNVRLTAWGRAELVHRIVEDGEPVALVAAALRVSRRTVYEWCRRFEAEGWPGRLKRSSRSHRSSRRMRPAVVRRICRLRLQRLTGPEIAE
ncbi:MAG: leucine zipper domain-containing protein [Gemmatimonadaceae bacterium]